MNNEKTTAKGYGEIVTWNVRSAFISKEVIETALTAAGIKVHVKKTRACTYLRRAIEQAINDGSVRKIGENDTHVAYAIVDEECSLSRIQYDARMREAIKLNKETGDVTFKTDNSLTRAIREGIAKNEGGLLSPEIGGVLTAIVTGACSGIGLRDTGGVYFVPEEKREVLDKAEQALRSIVNPGASIKINRLRVISGAREAKDIASVYVEAVMSEVSAMKHEVLEAARDIVRAKPSTFVKRAQRLKQLMENIGIYERTLTGMDFTQQADDVKRLHDMLLKYVKICRRKRDEARAERKLKK